MWSPYVALLALASFGTSTPVQGAAEPTVSVKNGTYSGVHSTVYRQDFFLGIPYAKPPVNHLRFRNPQSLNTTWTGVRPAHEHSSEVGLQDLCEMKVANICLVLWLQRWCSNAVESYFLLLTNKKSDQWNYQVSEV